jgi:HEAT repeat protein
MLGPQAASAIPTLAAMMRQREEPFKPYWATTAIAYLGKDSIPPLVEAIHNTDRDLRRHTIRAVGRMRYLGTNVLPVIPTLVECAKDSDINTAVCGVEALINLGMESTLAEVVNDKGATERENVIFAITLSKHLGTNSSQLIPAIVEFGKEVKGSGAINAIRCLRMLRADPKTALPVITNALASPAAHYRVDAIEALYYWNDTQLQSISPSLMTLTNDHDELVRHEAAKLVVRISPKPQTNSTPK